jgi:hypothetical protein
MARLGGARLGKAGRGGARHGEDRGFYENNSERRKTMEQYNVTLNGLTPLLMHQDNIGFSEKIQQWQRAPENKEYSVSGDDRSPAWVWLGYVYHDGKHFGMPSDNLMTMLREGGAKVLTGKGKETYKKQTQAGIMIDQQQWSLLVGGKEISIAPFNELIGNNTFTDHMEAAEKCGFELLVKRAKIGRAKHIRVRPLFRDWQLVGSLTVIDKEVSGITKEVLDTVMNQAGALCGLGDWRPSSPNSGTFGKFEPVIEKM